VAGRIWAAFTVVGLLISGCASGTRGGEQVVTSKGLVGSWKVESPDLVPGTVLTLAADLKWQTSCGIWVGEWRADNDGAFAGMVHGWEGDDCQPPHDGDPTPLWLREAVEYRLDGSAAELLDEDGEAVARLTLEGAPSAKASIDPVRAGLRAPEPLPSGVVAADRETLLGRWGPIGGSSAPQPPYLEIVEDGSWSASDGCNGSTGRWSAGADGSVVAVSGPSTEIGCDNLDTAGAFAGSSRAALDGETLVLIDSAGKELIRLGREG
jgi:hypothetical protein